jgi:TonB-linked SusC/RagA family outer membrane protein
MLNQKRMRGLNVAPTFLFAFLLFFFLSHYAVAQKRIIVTGKVFSESTNEPLRGASINEEGTSVYAVSDNDGSFTIQMASPSSKIIVTNVGYDAQVVKLTGVYTNLVIKLQVSKEAMENVIVVGYGRQKKESVVGAITQTTGKVLERAGGVTNLGMALTGNLPGVVTTTSTGMPGAEDPQILIRAQTSWNSSAPLILVDGVERSMSSIDISSVESISVLKDASATAVFGVKGANGVILITTKKGSIGKASIQVRTNTTAKVASKLPKKYDSYDALSLKNRVIENELSIVPAGWGAYKPENILLKYRNPANDEEWDRYPNVDWEKELFKKSTMSYGANVNVSGGTNFVTYFASVDFVSEGDLFKTFQNNRGYESGFGYTRTNVRSNLDFNLTKTTKFSTKLFGSNGVRKLPWNMADNDGGFWASAYRSASDAMRPIYSDGTWGFYSPRNADVPNSVYNLAVSGVENRTNTQLTTDFIIQQDLNMIIKGLSLRANYSLDNSFREIKRGINDLYNGPQRKWIDPETGLVTLENQINTGTQLDYSDMIRWAIQAGEVDKGQTYRRINYSGQLNYSRRFGQHDVGAMGLVLREKYATGGNLYRFREDWVFRTTYGYASKYHFEANGAYNGSEKFGPDFRFAFFPSLSAGWTISNEGFMDNVKFLNFLKVRGSWGRIGDDNVSGTWLYADQWGYGGNAQMGSPVANTPYTFYRITTLGNPAISWETVEKRNLGIEYGFFKGKISGSVDFFRDLRSDIIIDGNGRAVPTYFGAAAPKANLGRVLGKGYEIELKLNHTFGSGLQAWANFNVTHAKNTVLFRDDPELLPNYQKNAGQQMGQYKAYLDYGYLQSWDDIYGSTIRNANNANKLAGDYNIIDYNADGIIDQYDLVPYGYSGRPQNTYNASVGFDWKRLAIFVQFYGVNNVTRDVPFPTFNTYSGSNVAYVEGTYWTKENGGGDVPLPRYSSLMGTGGEGTRYMYDGSYVRLKNAEVAYTLSGVQVGRIGLKSCRIFLNGNNLLLWTKMPDDRESNFSGGGGSGAYPTVKRFNVGIDITL